MRQDWAVTELDQICDFRNGLWKGKKPPFQRVGIIRNTNFTKNCELDDSEIAYHDVEIKQFEKRQLQYGDLILEKSGGGPKQPVGRVITFEKEDGDFSFSNFTSVIRIKDADQIDFRFLHRCLFNYYLSGATESMQRRSTGIRNLDFSTYKKLPIPVPPLPEQRRIVATLDEAFEGIAAAKANAEKNLENAREVFESSLNRLFSEKGAGWEETVLDAVCEFENGDRGSNYPKKSEYTDSGMPWINTGHILPDGSLDLSKMNYISRQKYDSLRSGKIKPGDLVYCLRGATLGKTAVVDPIETGAVASSLVIIRPSVRIHSWFLYFYLRSSIGQSFIRMYQNGAAQPNLGAKSVAKFSVSLPAIDEQKRLVENIHLKTQQVEQMENTYQQKITAFDELKKSLLHQAFNGDL